MAWILQFDGINDYAPVTTPVVNPIPVGGSLRYKGYNQNTQSTLGIFIDVYSGAGNDFIATHGSNNVIRARIDGSLVDGSIVIPIDDFFELLIERTATQYIFSVDGVEDFRITKSVNMGDLQGFHLASFNNKMQLQECTLNNGTSNSHRWDATASSHTAGTPVLVDTVGGNNATGVNMPTDGSAWIDLGGGGATLTATMSEIGPSFSGSVSVNLSANLSASVSEQGPSFNDSISVSLAALAIGASITEQAPSFTEGIVSDVSSLAITATISETAPSFTESVSVELTPSLSINANISEIGPSFSESITCSLDANINASISEQGPSFLDVVSAQISKDIQAKILTQGPSFYEHSKIEIPVNITINTKNIVSVKRNNSNVIIKGKSNGIKIASKQNTIRVI